MNSTEIRDIITPVIKKYPVSKVTLFGSRARGDNGVGSDFDLIVEFTCGITLLTLSSLKCDLEDLLNLPVDIVHGPLQADDLIEVDAVEVMYEA